MISASRIALPFSQHDGRADEDTPRTQASNDKPAGCRVIPNQLPENKSSRNQPGQLAQCVDHYCPAPFSSS